MTTRLRAVVAAATALVALAGCGDVSPADGGGDRILETGDPMFAQQRLTWAHGTTLRYGDEELTLEGRAERLATSAYGFFVLEVEGRDRLRSVAERRMVFVDGDTLQEVPGEVSEVRTSLDGRYAGWIDRDGPLSLAGRVAEVVVVDLQSGEVVVTDSSGMGGELGDDLGDRYEELPPTFLGFDADSSHAYWYDAEGAGNRRRVDLTTGEISDASAPETDEEFPLPKGLVVDAFRGSEANESREGRAMRLQYGFLSPSGEHAVDISAPYRTEVYRVSPEQRVPIGFGRDRGQYFAGWLPGERFAVVSTARRISSYRVGGPDTLEGALRICSPQTRSCGRPVQVPGVRDLVVPGVLSILG